jgi:toxin HigB-1
MKIASIRHKGLKRLIEDDFKGGLPQIAIEKLKNIVAFLSAMDDIDELKALPLWKAHMLTGNRAGTWSLSVTRNYRLTFMQEGDTLILLDFEDYH